MKTNAGAVLRLDDLYRMTAYVYGDKNSTRHISSTFSHFVEVCGMLTVHVREKRQENVNVTDALCKALGWYFPLLAKLRVNSAEELIFRKFPRVCPYCRKSPHEDGICKVVRGTEKTLANEQVTEIFHKEWPARPEGLDDWQDMFQNIYPRALDGDKSRSVVGLFEELGELAEAVRVFESHPKYFLGEAADTFSYLMGIANEHRLRLAQRDIQFSFEHEFLSRYPGLCTQCGSKVCTCPNVPQATVGRMAKEIAIEKGRQTFIADADDFAIAGRRTANTVLETLGGYEGLTSDLPLDRGDANRALISICLSVANAVESRDAQLAENLRSEAYRINVQAKQPGTKRDPMDIDGLLGKLNETWKQLDQELRAEIKSSSELAREFGEMMEVVRVLFVHCSPRNQKRIRVSGELRVARDSVDRGPNREKVVIVDLPAATPDDLRRHLLKAKYDIVHFAGHAAQDVLVFETEEGKAHPVLLADLAELVGHNPSVQCVILNACSSVKNLKLPISPCTIGMDESIDDNAAIEFTRGFYDALAAGKTPGDAFKSGTIAVKFKGLDSSPLRILQT